MDASMFAQHVITLAFKSLHPTYPEWYDGVTFNAHLANYLRRMRVETAKAPLHRCISIAILHAVTGRAPRLRATDGSERDVRKWNKSRCISQDCLKEKCGSSFRRT